MKIVVLSDTHIPEKAQDLPAQIYKDLKEADLVLHAGDITSLAFLEKLQNLARIEAVYGNMDESKLKTSLPEKKLIKADKWTIGLMHGRGNPTFLIDLMQKEFARERPDVIVFGHSHTALSLRQDGILFFNPGSPTDKVFAPVNSYGIMIVGDGIKAEIVKIYG